MHRDLYYAYIFAFGIQFDFIMAIFFFTVHDILRNTEHLSLPIATGNQKNAGFTMLHVVVEADYMVWNIPCSFVFLYQMTWIPCSFVFLYQMTWRHNLNHGGGVFHNENNSNVNPLITSIVRTDLNNYISALKHYTRKLLIARYWLDY